MHLIISFSDKGFIYGFLNFVEPHGHSVGSFFGRKAGHLVILHQVLFYCLVFRLLNWRWSNTFSIIFVRSLAPPLQLHVMISVYVCVCGKLVLIFEQVCLILLKALQKIVKPIWTLCLESVCLEIVHWNVLSFWSLAKTHVQ